MEHLPPIGWADVSTKADLDHLRVATSADIENLRVATHADFAALGEKVDRSAAEIRAEVAIQLKESQRWTVTAMLSSTALLGTVLGVLIAVT